MCMDMCACVRACMCVYVYMCVCVRACMCVYVYMGVCEGVHVRVYAGVCVERERACGVLLGTFEWIIINRMSIRGNDKNQ